MADTTSQSVTIRGVEKNFGSFKAVTDFNLEVAAGEFVTFLGPSGCGKSTTLKMLSGLLPQDKGEILFGERRIDMLPANQRNVGLVFQNYALFPHMTVAENIAFGLSMRRWSKPRKQQRVAELLSLVRLEGLENRKPEQLSGGQQQRVAVARALAFNPDLVLLDEPLSNLDAKLREQVRLDLRDIQKHARQTTVFVTHDQVEALVMSDRIVLMNAGRIEQIGTPVELYAAPLTEFGARFVGANNLVPATLHGDASDPRAIVDGVDGTLALTSMSEQLNEGAGAPIWLCVRPEHIFLTAYETMPAGGEVRQFNARVVDKVYQGTSVLIDLEVEKLGRVRAERPTMAAAELQAGQQTSIAFSSCHAVPRRR